MWDALSVINAVNPEVFAFSNKGFVSVTEDGKIIFTENEKGNVQYQLVRDDKWAEDLLNMIRTSYKRK